MTLDRHHTARDAQRARRLAILGDIVACASLCGCIALGLIIALALS